MFVAEADLEGWKEEECLLKLNFSCILIFSQGQMQKIEKRVQATAATAAAELSRAAAARYFAVQEAKQKNRYTSHPYNVLVIVISPTPVV
jgi:hypothetical protein